MRRYKGFATVTAIVAVLLAMLSAAVANSAGRPAADSLLSLNKLVTASSAAGCCAAANAVDGNTSTRWASTANVDPSWIYVDLGAMYNVDRIELDWDASCATAYELDISPDHNAWTQIFSTTTGKGGADNHTGLKGTGRYVRMLGTKRCRADASHGYSLDEFSVYGGSGDTTPPSPPGTP
ncbi:MAG TPA: discoidin domain-containing protein, partial [Pseudonocardiaceae bacterium]